ncbi:MAG: hypothetical protein KDD38_10920 [Bdellovibrionales bacterium]|nr:hypothetical protein [Bdellovibrionales bacterium]
MGFFVSRFLGLGRDLLVSARWGVTEQSDMVLFLINFPDMVVGMLMGTAVSALLVPQFVKSKDANGDMNLYSSAQQALGLYGLIVTLVILLFSGELIRLLVPGFDLSTQAQAQDLLKWVAFAILFSFVAGVPRAGLLSKEYFKITSFENLFFNVPLIAIIYFLVNSESYSFLGWAVLLASLARYLYLQVGARWIGFRLRPVRMSWSSKVVLRFLSLNVTSGCTIILFFTLRALATELGPGQLSIFSYFFKFLELPFGILTTIVFSIGLPRLSSSTQIRHLKVLTYIFIFSVFVSLASAFILVLMQGHGFTFFKVTAGDIDLLLKTLIIGVFALPARLIMTYLQSFEYSNQSSKISLMANLAALGVSVIVIFSAGSSLSLNHLAWVLNIYYYMSAIIMLVWAFTHGFSTHSSKSAG